MSIQCQRRSLQREPRCSTKLLRASGRSQAGAVHRRRALLFSPLLCLECFVLPGHPLLSSLLLILPFTLRTAQSSRSWYFTDCSQSPSRRTCSWVPISPHNYNEANELSRPTPDTSTPSRTRVLLLERSARRNRRSQRLPHPAPLQRPVQHRSRGTIPDQLWRQI